MRVRGAVGGGNGGGVVKPKFPIDLGDVIVGADMADLIAFLHTLTASPKTAAALR